MADNTTAGKTIDKIRELVGDVKFISIDDTFEFGCVGCGKCCMHVGIPVTPFDVYNMSKALGIIPAEFVSKYCSVSYGKDSKIPVVSLNNDSNNKCQFLKLDMASCRMECCIPKNMRPGVCMLEPLGAVTQRSSEDPEKLEKKFFIKTPHCTHEGCTKIYKASEWLAPYREDEECHIKSESMISYTYLLFNFRKAYAVTHNSDYCGWENEKERLAAENISSDMKKAFDKFILSTMVKLHCGYDTSKPFLEQADESLKRTAALLNLAEFLFSTLGVSLDTDCHGAVLKKIFKTAEELEDAIDKITKEERGLAGELSYGCRIH